MPLKQGGLVFCTLVVKMSWGIQSQSRNNYVRQNEPNAGESTQGIEVDAKKANFLSLESPPSLNLSFPISHYEPCKCFFFFFLSIFLILKITKMILYCQVLMRKWEAHQKQQVTLIQARRDSKNSIYVHLHRNSLSSSLRR